MFWFGVAATLIPQHACKGGSGIPDKFDELEFVVVHRPHVTYLVDVKYFMCFATRKPDFQDLVKFHCPERLWKEVEESLQNKAVKPKTKKAKTDAKVER